jgi:hypothetical protein
VTPGPWFGSLVVTTQPGDCHLCGRALRSVTAHLRGHGWTKQAYCEVFGLERRQSLEGAATRKLRAAAFTSRLVFDPAVRAGSAVGRQRARSGALAQDAAVAATGRHHPEQRRRKARQAHAARPGVASPAPASAARTAQLAAVAARVAGQHGYPVLGVPSYLRDRLERHRTANA